MKRVVALALLLSALAACAPAKVAPAPVVGPPLSPSDVVGIWRTVHQAVLELRDDKSVVVVSALTGAMGGQYQVQNDTLQLNTDGRCAGITGRYTVRVKAAARMVLSNPDDGCGVRKRALTTDPWEYTPR